MEALKKNIVDFAGWAQENWLAVVIFLSIVMMMCLILVLFSWLFGYWANGLYGCRFPIDSVWNGVSILVASLGTVLTMAKACWTKYGTDSQYNSEEGIRPANLYSRHTINDPCLSKESINTAVKSGSRYDP